MRPRPQSNDLELIYVKRWDISIVIIGETKLQQPVGLVCRRNKRMKDWVFWLAISAAALFNSAPVMAHHGEANYDTDKLVSVKATVTDFQFINPHAQIYLEAKNDKGEIEK